MVFEYLNHDLTGLLDSPGLATVFTEANQKYLLKELLQSLYFCHKHGVLHRDIKGAAQSWVAKRA